jgi:hypothetical protein
MATKNTKEEFFDKLSSLISELKITDGDMYIQWNLVPVTISPI